MTMLRNLWLVVLIALPALATWRWWEDGMWSNGELPTHGLAQVISGCGLAVALYSLVRLIDRRRRNGTGK